MTFIWLVMLLQSEEPRRMPLQVSTAERSIQGVIHLVDESSIAHLITAFNKDDISIEARQNKLFIKLLKEVEGSIDCIGGSGRLYRVTVVPSARSVTLLSIKAPADRSSAAAEVPLPLQLMKAMRLGRPIEGATVARSSAILVDDPVLIVQLQWVYKLDGLTGLVCTVRNRTMETLRLDPSRFHAEGVLVVGFRDLKLGAGEVTRLLMVVREDEHE